MSYYKSYRYIKSPEELHETILKDIGEASNKGCELIVLEYEKIKFYGEDRYSLELEMRDKDDIC
ncbi:hypothetical protein MHB40_14770 [Lysinibacillus sp. FSL K6-0057]|uniref:hypothetical protein n=1 Tax=Lysinibacillus sp. FSL K6-0057 TaxID=2921411 RepID=UPI00315A4BC7